MSDQAEEAAPGPGVTATAAASEPVAKKEDNASPTATKLEHKNGSVGGDAINGAKKAVLDQEMGENASNVQKEDATKYRGDWKRNFNNSKDRPRNDYPRRQNKSKYDPNAEPVPEDAAARLQSIRNLADFYFSDSNLRTDRFLLDLTEGETNLPVKVKVIHDFNRMKKYDYGEVVTALRASVTLDITGPEGLEEIRRKVPFDPNKTDDREQRTVYVKGFGEELPSSQFDIEAFFAQYGPTNSVRLRRTDDKLFKGSCNVEFQDVETAQSFLNLDPKPLWKGKHELEIMSKFDYLKRKNQAIRSDDADPNETRPLRGSGRGGRGGGYRNNRDRRDGGDRDPDDWKKRREDDQKSGFRDNRRDRDNNRHHNGRGGRGRGRGNDRDRRNNDRNQERNHEARTKFEKGSEEVDEKPIDLADTKADKEEVTKKRARDNDTGADETPSKRIDQKDEISADTS